MPLSEDEQRILRQIERELRADPGFDAEGYHASPIRLAWLGIGLVAGVAFTIAALTLHPLLAFGIFIGVLWLGLRFEDEAREVVRDRMPEGGAEHWIPRVAKRGEPSDDGHDE